MSLGQHREPPRGRLRVSLNEESSGVKNVDLFVDYTSSCHKLDSIPSASHTISDLLRSVLTPIACPACNSKKFKLTVSGTISERLLKMTGRRVFRCPECNARRIVKVHRWEWEIVGTFLAAAVVLLLFLLSWIIR